MLILAEFFFIAFLTLMLFLLYRSERSSRRESSPHALIKECWNGIERRRHVRFTKNLVAAYTIEKKNHLRNDGQTVNVSEGGLKLLLNEKLPKGTILDLKIDLSDTDKAAEAAGVVVWSEDAGRRDAAGKLLFYSGIEFLAARQSANKHLLDYIRSIASQSMET